VTSEAGSTGDEFRHRGYALVDWVADYLERVEELSVHSRASPGQLRASLPDHPPEQPESFEAVLADLDELVVPGLTHWQSPSFFGYFPANNSPPSILAELVSAGLGVQGMSWATSPAATELETHVLDWLAELLALPEHFFSDGPGGGVLHDSTSTATLTALVAARDRATDGETKTAGVDRTLTLYASAQAHSSVEKAARIAGLGSDQLRTIAVDSAYAMEPEALEAAISADVEAGATPCAVVATAGTTSSLAFDPLEPIGEICDRYGVWLHVDAALTGTAAVCPELRFVHRGLEAADSYCVNPHKWMLTNFDATAFYVADAAALTAALAITPEYLRTAPGDAGTVTDYRDWQLPLGRRFRALKLWFVLRWYGAEGIREHVRRHVALAAELAAWVRTDDRFELAAPVALSLVSFRHVNGDAATQALLDRVNDSGEALLTHTRLDGRLVARVAIGARLTERRHVVELWRLLAELADPLS
jgi:aromatic-L-amino-acid decarboxylase